MREGLRRREKAMAEGGRTCLMSLSVGFSCTSTTTLICFARSAYLPRGEQGCSAVRRACHVSPRAVEGRCVPES